MTQCWSEGEIRAYLDDELPLRDIDRLTGHMSECSACNARLEELTSRAQQVTSWMGALSMPPQPIRIPVAPRRTRSGTRVAVFATGLAASLVIAMIVLPKHSQEIVVAPRPQTAVPQTVTPPPATVRPAIIRRETPRAVPPKPKPKIQYYVALDDEPIETGLVVRVGLSGGQIPADVIIGPDGRARAIRLVSDVSGEPK